MKTLTGFFFLLLTACSTNQTFKPLTDGSRTYTSPADYSDWQFQGRIAIRRGDEGWHASLFWQSSDTGYRIKISGPLGWGVVHLSGNDEAVLLQTADGKIITASEPGQLLEQVTGWTLPVAGMRYWVRGLPVPGVSSQETRNRLGWPQHLQQSGWDINYQGFHRWQQADWPSRIRFEAGDVVVKLIIDRWLSGPVNASESMQSESGEP